MKGDAMDAIGNTAQIKDRRMRLSALWIFATLNYIYADVFTLFFVPGAQKTTGAMSAGGALAFAILMETAIAMVLLSWVLKYRANRWTNIVVAVIQTASVVSSLFTAPPPPFYVFFAAVEILCTLVIMWYAWTWRHAAA
jgi:isoprenylcysteine carboxyl methyltransferase (ICMT) family protein YpbQ